MVSSAEGLVGREAELAVAAAAVGQLSEGRALALAIEGEAGIGKTRLAQSIVDDAGSRGLAVFYGQAHPFERTRPFGVVAAALDLSRRSPDPRRAAIGALLAGQGAGAPARAAGDIQYRVVEEIVDLVETSCAERPVLLVAEDIHWADSASLLAILSVTRQLPLAALLVVSLVGYAAARLTFNGGEHFVAVSQLFAQTGAFYVPTLVIFGLEDYYQTSLMNAHDDAKARRFIPHLKFDRDVHNYSKWRMPQELAVKRHGESVRDLVRGGVKVGLGSHGQVQGIGAHWELWMLQSGDMTPMEAVRIATLYGASDEWHQVYTPGRMSEFRDFRNDAVDDRVIHSRPVSRERANLEDLQMGIPDRASAQLGGSSIRDLAVRRGQFAGDTISQLRDSSPRDDHVFIRERHVGRSPNASARTPGNVTAFVQDEELPPPTRQDVEGRCIDLQPADLKTGGDQRVEDRVENVSGRRVSSSGKALREAVSDARRDRLRRRRNAWGCAFHALGYIRTECSRPGTCS
jgi:hypothetical protein